MPPQSGEPLVSVIIPFRQHYDLLTSLLASLSSQMPVGTPPVEIIVIDDANEPPLGPDFVAALVPCQTSVLRCSPHRSYGLPVLRNIGIAAARGHMVICLDQDTICPPTFLGAHWSFHEERPRRAAFGFRHFIDASHISDPSERTFERCWQLPSVASISAGGQMEDRRIAECAAFDPHPCPYHLLFGCNMSFRRADALQVGLFDVRFCEGFGYEDIEFGYRLWKAGVDISYCSGVDVLHQENNVIPASCRKSGSQLNRDLLYRLVPGIREFRIRFADVAYGV